VRRAAKHDCGPNVGIKGASMLDVIMLAIGIGFFAIALAFVAACERL
jgi:hypothetical protein